MTKQHFNNLHLLALVMALTIAALGIPSAHAQFSDIHDFDTPFLASPQFSGVLAEGRDGYLYGTTPLGGDFGRGGVFRVDQSGNYSVVSSFDSTLANPYGGLTLGADGNFYGTTYNGGAFLFGTVFQITPGGFVTVLHSFKLAEGAGAYAPPIQGTDGNFYGTTTTGALGFGAVYKVTPAGVFTPLYQFDITHGSTPIAPLIQAKDGNFYGTTKVGGTFGFGTAFKITPAGVLTVLYNFDSTHGAEPYAPLVQGKDGNFYGTTRSGGTLNNGGVAFKLTAAKKLTVLHNFNATGQTTDGTRPYAGLVQANDGKFYGVTSAGGNNGLGIFYEIDSTILCCYLHDFDAATGSFPTTALIQHTNGHLYGEATSGGAFTHGALFTFNLGQIAHEFIVAQPAAGVVSQPVGLLGGNYAGRPVISVKFNGKAAAFTVVSDNYITTSVPAGATTGLIKVVRAIGSVQTNQKFLVIPVVLNFKPGSGAVGSSVVITGNSLTGATKVTFGGAKKAVFTVDSYTQITATVPAGAVSGKIQVTTPGGTATSPTAFTVN